MSAFNCPNCGRPLVAEDAAAGAVQRCFHCGQVIAARHTAPVVAGLTWTPLELGWSLRDRVVSAFAKPLKDLQTISEKAVGPAALADANEPGLFQRACMTGLAAITDLAREEILPELVRTVLRKLPDHYTELLSLLQPPSHALMLAAPDIRKIQHVTGMAGLLHKGAQAANPKTIRGTAAIGGAAVGSVHHAWHRHRHRRRHRVLARQQRIHGARHGGNRPLPECVPPHVGRRRRFAA